MLRHTLAISRHLKTTTAVTGINTYFIRGLSSTSSWTSDFTSATEHICSDVSFTESANILRELCKKDLVKGTDIIDAPHRFFEAHRILARHATAAGPGFWVRFTVHYNLFAGTILAVGNDEQVAQLARYQDEGLLGCFALTEKLAGVQSGLVVRTTAVWDQENGRFVLHTPDEGARKNWISQGFTADKAVVIADLTVNNERVGPHAFVMDFRRDGELVAGISVDDMGTKTAGNDLDNAWIHFDNVEVDRDAMLSKYANINERGEYELIHKDVRPFDMIGQRLYTGRICVAQAALEYRRRLFEQTKEYANNKKIFSFKGERVLADIPQLSAIFRENDESMKRIDQFVKSCELKLSDSIRSGSPPSNELVEAIATCKVKAVEESIDTCFRLKNEVGSFALMGESGFGNMDFLQACKFAEGDSRILMQKLARDRLKQFAAAAKRNPLKTMFGAVEGFSDDEKRLCKTLGKSMGAAIKAGVDKQRAWDDEWETVYELANAVIERVLMTHDTHASASESSSNVDKAA